MVLKGNLLQATITMKYKNNLLTINKK